MMFLVKVMMDLLRFVLNIDYSYTIILPNHSMVYLFFSLIVALNSIVFAGCSGRKKNVAQINVSWRQYNLSTVAYRVTLEIKI